MKLLLLTSVLLSFLHMNQAHAMFKDISKTSLPDKQTERLYELQDAVDEHENLTTLAPLISELVQQGKYKQAKLYLAIAQDYIVKPEEKNQVRLLITQYYLAQDKVCQVHQLLNSAKANNETMPEIELALNDYQQAHPINSKSLSCMLSASRSLASSRGLKRTHSINMAIAFESNSADLTVKGKSQVQQLAKSLQSLKLKSYKVNFVGHTDLRGMASYNMVLSQKRAESVYREVIFHQPRFTGEINYFGKGETQPKIIKQSEQAHQLNRRVEVYLTKD